MQRMEEVGVPKSGFRAPWILVAAAGVLLTACGGGGGGGGSGNGAPVKVGYLVPLTGTFASNGKNEQNGFDLGLKDFGSTVNGHRIQVTYLDTQADPNIALSQARQLIRSEERRVGKECRYRWWTYH